jgi:hypothetical protein
VKVGKENNKFIFYSKEEILGNDHSGTL